MAFSECVKSSNLKNSCRSQVYACYNPKNNQEKNLNKIIKLTTQSKMKWKNKYPWVTKI